MSTEDLAVVIDGLPLVDHHVHLRRIDRARARHRCGRRAEPGPGGESRATGSSPASG
ncbi:hypothetical protein [Saccharopolyspora pogona]|uniref:hypothetical protein n=1 Tax=Saccharopolyspora pogona TaxID=333966 RepID=UPI001684FE74|nr:hypothetical protein [Saccharopolyspora pogona]